VPAFIELLDAEEIAGAADPFQTRLQGLLK
jgi:hypothetical protein